MTIDYLINVEVNQNGYYIPELTSMITNMLYNLYISPLINPEYNSYVEFDRMLNKKSLYTSDLKYIKLYYFSYNWNKTNKSETPDEYGVCEICRRDSILCHIMMDYQICGFCFKVIDSDISELRKPNQEIMYILELEF
jgi:hypothetical protein